MSDSWNHGAVWVVWRRDRSYRIRFPGRANAERWLENHSRELWDIVPIEDAIISTDQSPAIPADPDRGSLREAHPTEDALH